MVARSRDKGARSGRRNDARRRFGSSGNDVSFLAGCSRGGRPAAKNKKNNFFPAPAESGGRRFAAGLGAERKRFLQLMKSCARTVLRPLAFARFAACSS